MALLPPGATTAAELPTAAAIATRRSTRAYATDRPMRPELGDLLHLAAGLTADVAAARAEPHLIRGALPDRIYAVVHRVEGLEPGVYHYAVREHGLEMLRTGDFRAAVVEQAIAQEFLGECGMVLFRR